MKPSELTALMHAVLDGEATPAEARELERRLAAEPEARAEFHSLRALFDELKGMPQAFPPEGLVASVMADLPSFQLSAPSRVISTTTQAFPGHIAGGPISDTARRASRSVLFSGSERMNEQKSGARSKRTVIWVGGAIAALAVILVATSGIDFPPGGTSTWGAIVPAQRFRAEQPATTGVSAPGQSESAQRASQVTPGNIGDARSADARASDGIKADSLRADGLHTDSLKAADGLKADSLKADSLKADSLRSDGLHADSLKADSLKADSLKADSLKADSLKADSLKADSLKADSLKADRRADNRISQ